ncbi:hypothetical protein [Sinomonas mesophila]|nr:hypothetical protein [Sinomonas mesophila]
MKRRTLVHEHMLEWLQEQAEDDASPREQQPRPAGADPRKVGAARS